MKSKSKTKRGRVSSLGGKSVGQAMQMDAGWRASRYKASYRQEGTVEPSSIGYPQVESELATFSRKQIQRAQQTLSSNGNGLLTEHEAELIKRAREKRIRQAQNQRKGQNHV